MFTPRTCGAVRIPTRRPLIVGRNSGWSIAFGGMTENIDGFSKLEYQGLARIALLLVTSESALMLRTADSRKENSVCANQRLSLALQAGRAASWGWDIKSGRNLWFGDTHALLGTTPETHLESVEEFLDRVHPEDRVRLDEALEISKQNNTEFNEEFRVVWPDGTVHWLRSQGRYSYGANDEAERVLGITIDITERKLAEVALAGVSGKLIEAQGLLENLPLDQQVFDDVHRWLSVETFKGCKIFSFTT